MRGLAICATLSFTGCCLEIVSGVAEHPTTDRSDAGNEADAGIDGGGVGDGGGDAGAQEDAGFDAGPQADAGLDAGKERDAGADAGAAVDAGADAGLTDAGSAGCSPDSGVVIYAVSASELYEIDPVTWTPTRILSFDSSLFLTDVAVSPSNEIYVTSFTALYSVDLKQGASLVIPDEAAFNAMTFLADGTLLGVSGEGSVSSVDLAHQTLTSIGSYGPGYGSSGDLVAVSDGTIYATSITSPVMSGPGDFLLKVDPRTAQATTVGPIGFGEVWGLAYYGGAVIAFTAGGQILKIDTDTGAGKLLGSTGASYYGAGVTPVVAPRCP